MKIFFQICGIAVNIKLKGELAQGCRIVDVNISGQPHRSFTLFPSIDNTKRCITVNGASCNDVSTSYNIVGLETMSYQLSVG